MGPWNCVMIIAYTIQLIFTIALGSDAIRLNHIELLTISGHF